MENSLPAFLMLLGLLAGGSLLAAGYWIRDYRERARQRAMAVSANDPEGTKGASRPWTIWKRQ